MGTRSSLRRTLCACARAMLECSAFVVEIAVLSCVPATTAVAQSAGTERAVLTAVPLSMTQIPTRLQPGTDWFVSGTTRTAVAKARPETLQSQAAAPAEEDGGWRLGVVAGYEHKKQHLESKSSYTERTFYPPGRAPVVIVEDEVSQGTKFTWASDTPYGGVELSAPPTEHFSFSVHSYFFDSFDELTVGSGGFDVNALGVSAGVILNMVAKRGQNGWRGHALYEHVRYFSDTFERQKPYGASQGVTPTRDEIVQKSRYENRVTFVGGYNAGRLFVYGTTGIALTSIQIDATIEGKGPASSGAIPFSILSKDALKADQSLWGGGGVEIPIGAAFMLRTETLTNGDGVTFNVLTTIPVATFWW